MSASDAAIIPAINETFGLTLPASISLEELKQRLTVHINYLINHDFEKLVYNLYRVDVNEKKMRHLLDQKGGENAAELIAELVIERQAEKAASRRSHGKQNGPDNDEDKW